MAHLHLDRYVQLDAFGVKGIVLSVIRRQLEPMRIEMGADKAQFADRVFEFAHAVHAFIGIDARQAAKTLRIFLDHVGDHFIGQLPVRRMALAAGLAGRDKRQLNSRRIHSLYIFFDRQAVDEFPSSAPIFPSKNSRRHLGLSGSTSGV